MTLKGVMASDSNHMFPAWFIIFAFFFFHVSLASISYEGKGLIRSRREVCVDGIYEYEHRNCCLCGAGQRLKAHCSASEGDTKCEHCESGTYNSHPNSQQTCEPCTSCSHPNANLKVREPCKPDSDTKCQCKEHHYCSSGTEETCRLCNPCKVCGAEGIKLTCTATSDTVCNDKSEGGKQLAITLGIVIPLLLIIVLGIVFGVYWRRRQHRMRQQHITSPNNAAEVELPLLKDLDLLPHLPDIAEGLGWKVMRDIAIRSNIPDTTIDACKLDHPGDSQEQTLQLLKIWVEQQGMGASRNLIETLQNSGEKRKAEILAAKIAQWQQH